MIKTIYQLHSFLYNSINDMNEVIYQDEESIYDVMEKLRLNQPLFPDEFYVLCYHLMEDILYNCVFSKSPGLKERHFKPLEEKYADIHKQIEEYIDPKLKSFEPAIQDIVYYHLYYSRLAQLYLAPIFLKSYE